ncbi:MULTISPECIES: trypsin-like serine protease [Curtobacterium]|jgi:hypothetical protein|uniref:Trypsin-like serine protease n=2 Tax=Curtobacterium TaxID=2034 RepID=A0A9Q2ZQD2_9MICO|nr:trypsin-like serine protease [Curtobacterium flaccumfaciens]MBO9041510.1 trypsin-like serine protease [Curtobacterium flaccumfaciens pv. flaccumfaciens]MBO9044996.1 trypsin-like serine protease [Curtobacterium flaccumfaciens pv. flaccumfaciens]MBO9048862.1 trypsin-like serine protease [Curtobacterium flaccumfaciens pv. flaccumfaciens]MBO9057712.1 trypsin-like serine protease [Curtobacterium flaccumfaciens pv. flaccumfaciens]MBT1543053.1 trypsin-like serine protease [Curtobacterium flaccumfa
MTHRSLQVGALCAVIGVAFAGAFAPADSASAAPSDLAATTSQQLPVIQATPPASGSIADQKPRISERLQLPIVAGTRLLVDNTSCTAGAVLYRSSLFGRITQAQRATRYIITAKHCGDVGSTVYVNGAVVGHVVRTSDDFDVSLIAVPPAPFLRQQCSVTHSGGPFCTTVTDYAPRARGMVLVGGTAVPFAIPINVLGAGAPTPDEDFCASGSFSGWFCGFHTRPIEATLRTNGYDQKAMSYSWMLQQGDSGGPVVTRNGTLYGIVSARGRQEPRAMYYVSMHEALAQFPGFALQRG